MNEGVEGLLRDKTRPSRIPPLSEAIKAQVIEKTKMAPPPEATHWTAAMMSEAVGISATSVQRIWRAQRLQPHRTRQFNLSTDLSFAAQQPTIVGLYIDPPAHAIVVSVDKTAQANAPGQPLTDPPTKKRQIAARADDKELSPNRRRQQEFIRFLNAIQSAVAGDKSFHVILDNNSPNKTSKTRAWLDRHPRFVFHYASTPWFQAVEAFLAKLHKRHLKHGELMAAINALLSESNIEPYDRVADRDKILVAVRGR
jgi:hypothetical protein